MGVEETDIRQAARSRVEESHSRQRKDTESKDNQMFTKFTSPGMINAGSNQNIIKEPKPVITNGSAVKSQTDTRLDLSSVHSETSPQASVSPRSEAKSLSPRSFSVPGSSFQFQADYKVLKNDTAAFYDYLKVRYNEIVFFHNKQ